MEVRADWSTPSITGRSLSGRNQREALMVVGMSWGDGFDPSYCHMRDSHRGCLLPAVVDSYPIDESVYGVRGLAGNMMDWTLSHYRADWGETEDYSHLVYRGGRWSNDARYARASNRYSYDPSYRYYNFGFRLLRTF